MAERAAHLVDHVFPPVPVRQWVLSLPHRLGYRLAWDHDLCRAIVGQTMRAILGFHRRRARDAGVADGRSGAVTIVQRFGGALNTNIHFHAFVLDGVFAREGDGLRFHPCPGLDAGDVDEVLATVEAYLHRLLGGRGEGSDEALEVGHDRIVWALDAATRAFLWAQQTNHQTSWWISTPEPPGHHRPVAEIPPPAGEFVFVCPSALGGIKSAGRSRPAQDKRTVRARQQRCLNPTIHQFRERRGSSPRLAADRQEPAPHIDVRSAGSQAGPGHARTAAGLAPAGEYRRPGPDRG